MSQDAHCEPAASVIARLGGPSAVAAIVDLSAIQVRRWRRPEPHGTGGKIPDKAKIKLIEFAFTEGIDLTWDHFKPPELGPHTALNTS